MTSQSNNGSKNAYDNTLNASIVMVQGYIDLVGAGKLAIICICCRIAQCLA